MRCGILGKTYKFEFPFALGKDQLDIKRWEEYFLSIQLKKLDQGWTPAKFTCAKALIRWCFFCACYICLWLAEWEHFRVRRYTREAVSPISFGRPPHIDWTQLVTEISHHHEVTMMQVQNHKIDPLTQNPSLTNREFIDPGNVTRSELELIETCQIIDNIAETSHEIRIGGFNHG